MRIDVPLLPFSVEVRWRPLPPWRVSTRGMMVVVALAAVPLFLLGRLAYLNRATRYHADEAVEALLAHPLVHLPPSAKEQWHRAMAAQYRTQAERADALAFVALVACAILVAVAVAGRILNRMIQRVGKPSEDAPGI